MTDQPPGGQDPQFSAGPPPQGQQQGYVPTSDDKTMAILAHAGQVVVGFLAPLIIMLIKGNESSYVRAHSVEALNFAITVIIAYVVVTFLTIITLGFGSILYFFPWIWQVVFSIIAAVKASNNEFYRYPATLRLIK